MRSVSQCFDLGWVCIDQTKNPMESRCAFLIFGFAVRTCFNGFHSSDDSARWFRERYSRSLLLQPDVFALRIDPSNVRAAHFDLAVAHADLENRLRMHRRTFEYLPIVQRKTRAVPWAPDRMAFQFSL
jgi:hypothetical protein